MLITKPEEMSKKTVTPEDWFKDGNFWRHLGSTDYGDLIFNTLSRIFDMKDTSEWAYDAFYECAELLYDHKRWADRFNEEADAKNRYYYHIGKLLGWIGIKKIVPERSQDDMTRDPYAPFYACAVSLGEEAYIKYITMPWYVYNYTASKERKRLIKDDRKMFVKRLGYYRKAAYNLINQNNPQIISNKLEIKA